MRNIIIRYSTYTILLGIFIIFSGCKKNIKLSDELLFPPTSISATKSGTSINITWSAVLGTTSYKVYRSSSSTGGYTYLSTSTLTNYTDLLPLNGDNYYKVLSVNNYGKESELSDYAYFNYNNAISVKPSTPIIDNVFKSGKNIYIDWSLVSNATSYKVYRSSSSTGDYTLLGTYISINCFDFTPLNRDNYYKVSAVNSAGESSLSNNYGHYDYLEYLPDKPYSSSCKQNGAAVNISWSAVSGATGYKVYRSSSSTGSYTLLGTYTGTSAIDNSPLNEYNWYKIIAFNSFGDSQYSTYDFCFYVLSIPATPNPMGDFPIVAISRKLKITWDAVPGATYYKVYMSLDNPDNFYYKANPTSNIYWDDNPINNHYHYYKVSAVNSAGESPLSGFSAYFFSVY